jgi:hypothetical protein
MGVVAPLIAGFGCICAVSAVINSRVKPIDMRKMVVVAAVMASLAFASVFVAVNYVF